jgi:hypothetical protein
MTDGSESGTASIALPDNPPSIMVMRARKQATALNRCIYIYGSRSNWLMTMDLSEPPSSAPVWMVPANENHRGRQNRGGR